MAKKKKHGAPKVTTRCARGRGAPASQEPEQTTLRSKLATRRNTPAELFTDEVALWHLLRATLVHHGDAELLRMAGTCRTWRKAARRTFQLRIPPLDFGELKTGEQHGRFDRPHGAAFVDEHLVVLADTDNFRLQVWSREGEHVDSESLTGCPTAVVPDTADCDEDRSLFVVEHGAHKLTKLPLGRILYLDEEDDDLDGEIATRGWGGGPGQLRHPWGLALAPSREIVYVSDGGNGRICAFSASSLDFQFAFGTPGAGPGELNDPRGMCARECPTRPKRPKPGVPSANATRRRPLNEGREYSCHERGELYVADAANDRLQVTRDTAEIQPRYARPSCTSPTRRTTGSR